jgi:hypothetical protein
VIVGDLHGDWKVWRRILEHSGCIDKNGKWIGKGIRLIQLGDIMDRGGRMVPYIDADEEWKILSDICQYRYDALKYNSEVHFILGNHEWMNVQGLFSYVSPKGMNGSMKYYKQWIESDIGMKGGMVRNNEEARKRLFEPGSPIAKIFAYIGKPMYKVEDRMYVHGGLTMNHIKLTTDMKEIEEVYEKMMLGIPIKTERERKIYETYFDSMDAIWYTRYMGMEMGKQEEIEKILKGFGVSKIFLGHTPQMMFGGIRGIYKNRVFLCDSGRYEAYGLRNNKKPKIEYAVFYPDKNVFQSVQIPL